MIHDEAPSTAPPQPTESTKLHNPTILNHINQFYHSLNAIPISTLLAHKRARSPDNSLALVSVDEATPLRDVLEIMAEKNIQAVPVYKLEPSNEGGRGEKRFTGIVSIYDVLAWTVFQKLFDDLEELNTGSQTGTTSKRFLDLDKEADLYFSTPVETLVGFTAESSCSWSLHSTEPLTSLLQMITTPPYHRMLIVDVDRAVQSVTFDEDDVPHGGDACIVMVTQTDLLQFIYDYRDSINEISFNNLLRAPIEQVELFAKENLRSLRNMDVDPNQLSTAAGSQKSSVVTVPASYTALNAFRVMYLNRVSAVAVVSDNGGQIVANLSATDLKGMTADMESLESLLMPVFEFLETKSKSRGVDQIKADQLRCVGKGQVLETAIEVLKADQIHRVWIQDEEEKPVGVLTMGDILSFFVPLGQVEKETVY
ncbi:hypothetical protein HDU79_010624 [Rhizoclosmatium sp. JEL0117]|nr:hypothetical protein HDU79_010624 [Rhizoclosmatium sp. JEL0117]